MIESSSVEHASSKSSKLDGMLFINSGNSYAGADYLGSGQETKPLTLDEELEYYTGNFLESIGVLIKDLIKRISKDNFISWLIILFSSQPN